MSLFHCHFFESHSKVFDKFLPHLHKVKVKFAHELLTTWRTCNRGELWVVLHRVWWTFTKRGTLEHYFEFVKGVCLS